MHNFTFYGQVVDSSDPGEPKPLAIYPPTQPFTTIAANPLQALEVYFIEGPGGLTTADEERKIIENFGLDHISVLVRDTEQDVIYYAHVHIEWDGNSWQRHFEVEPQFTLPGVPVTQEI